jgi:hypothetical protein
VDVVRALNSAATSVQRHLTASTSPSIPSFQQNTEAQMPDSTVVLVGRFSVVKRSYLILRVEWHPAEGRWTVRVDPVSASDLIVIGDETQRARRIARQIRRCRSNPEQDWRMEPLATIHNAINDPNRTTVGGRLQLVKVYMHGATNAYGFVEPMGGDEVHARGALVDARASHEVAFNGRLIDLAAYRWTEGAYAARRSL